MKNIQIAVVIYFLIEMVISRRHRRHKKRQLDPTEVTAIQEMNIRNRGTFVLNYVDPFDRIGFWNQSDPNQNGAEGRGSE